MVDYGVKALNSDTTSLEKMVIRVGIVGGTGYTGVELLRILAVHPEVSVSCITSRSEAGMPVADRSTTRTPADISSGTILMATP